MILLLVKFDVKKGQVDGFMDVINPLIEGSRKEAGCFEYNLFLEDDTTNKFILVEKWQNQDALDFHNNTDHFIEYAPQLQSFCHAITAERYA